MTRVQGSKFLYTASGRSAYLPGGQSVDVVVTTEDGRIGVLTDHDRWYVAILNAGSGNTTATVLKVHGGKPYAYRDAERLASRRDIQAAVPQLAGMDPAVAGIMAKRLATVRTTTKEQDEGVARKAPFFIAAVVVLALVTPPILLIVWIPAVIFLAYAWLGARSDG